LHFRITNIVGLLRSRADSECILMMVVMPAPRK